MTSVSVPVLYYNTCLLSWRGLRSWQKQKLISLLFFQCHTTKFGVCPQAKALLLLYYVVDALPLSLMCVHDHECHVGYACRVLPCTCNKFKHVRWDNRISRDAHALEYIFACNIYLSSWGLDTPVRVNGVVSCFARFQFWRGNGYVRSSGRAHTWPRI